MDTFATTRFTMRCTRRLSGLILSIRRLSVTLGLVRCSGQGYDRDMIEIFRLRGLSTGLFLAAVVFCA